MFSHKSIKNIDISNLAWRKEDFNFNHISFSYAIDFVICISIVNIHLSDFAKECFITHYNAWYALYVNILLNIISLSV